MINVLTVVLFLFHQNADYKIDLGQYYDSELHEKPNGYVEAFTILDAEGNQEYVLSITKVGMPKGRLLPDVYSEQYKMAILSKCGCDIVSSKQQSFTNFNAQEFKILRNGKHAYVLSATTDGNLYNISYSSDGEANTEAKYPEFERVMNTMVFYN
jgi:hypothetical protein